MKNGFLRHIVNLILHYKMMNATMINSTLTRKWNGYNFGVSFSQLTNSDAYDWSTYDPYFFLTRELNVSDHAQYIEAKKNNLIRHCKPYRGRWLDYIVMKEFDTLSDWVTDCGATLTDVVYGVNRVHKYKWVHSEGQNRRVPHTPKYICLAHLLEQLGYVAPPQEQTTSVNIKDVLESRGLTLDNLWVIANGTPVQWSTFVTA